VQIPDKPEAAEATWHEAEIGLRFDDVAQDGRLRLEALPPSLGATTWRALMKTPTGKSALGTGIVPILSRLVIVGGDGPFGVEPPLRARGAYAFAHVPGPSTEPERLLLGMWIEASAPLGRVYGAPSEGSGTIASAGSLYAEHTLTKLFAPPSERKVTRLSLEGIEGVPPHAMPLVRGEDVVRAPDDAVWLEPEASDDAVSFRFGLTHTDSNQHVNSLVYIRLFEEAALRRIAGLGKSAAVLAREVHVVYRKPCFAGDVVRVRARAYTRDGSIGVVGTFAKADEPDRPTGHVHMVLR
jgi:hypothetical protein